MVKKLNSSHSDTNFSAGMVEDNTSYEVGGITFIVESAHKTEGESIKEILERLMKNEVENSG